MEKPNNIVSQLILMFLITGALIFISCKSDKREESVLKKPNIILIYADDMGWGDAGYNGRKDITTPNIDALAKQGVTFTQGYVSSSVCGPSRAGILTGVYQQRFGFLENTPDGNFLNSDNEAPSLYGLPISQPIISEVLKKQGYHTGMVGKWHLGMDEGLRPYNRGFDYFYGFLNGSHDYYRADKGFGNQLDFWPLYKNDKKVANYKGYFTESFSNEAVKYIERNKDKPFFLYVAYNAVHYPWQVPDKYIERVKHLSSSIDKQVFGGMLLAMDDGVGIILESLKKNHIDDNTIVIFCSDNGSPRGQGLNEGPKNYQLERGLHQMSSQGAFRGFKGDTYEGGIRVPFVIKWPGEIAANTIYENPVITLDILPTLANYIGIENSEHKGLSFDGVNILPFIKGGKGIERPHELMYWRRREDYAIRKGDWKLTWNDESIQNPGIQLFNMADDKYERIDLSTKYPELTLELQKEFDKWDRKLPDCDWWGTPENRKLDRNK